VFAAPASVGTSGSAPAGTLLVAAADTGTTAAIFVSPMDAGKDIAAAASELVAALDAGSPADALDSGTAQLPDGRRVDFDLTADADTWVITAIDGSDTDRELTKWPRLQGSIER